MVRILVFGNSITYGYYDKDGGWVQRLRNSLYEKMLLDPDFDYSVYNLGISGDTTEDLLERLEFETKQRMKENEEVIIIFEIGTNDSAILSTKKDFWVSQGKFRDNIEEILKKSKKLSKNIFFVGLTPIDENKTRPVPYDKRVTYKNENIKKYNEILKEVCNKEGIPFIEVFDKFYKSNYKKLLQDGVHPNSEGHEKIFEIVKDYLIKNKII